MVKVGFFWSPLTITLVLSFGAVGRCVESKAVEVPSYRGSDRPPYYEYAARARYIVHKADWAIMSTYSIQPDIEGYPFGDIISISDGLPNNSTGIPYMYVSPYSLTVKNFQVLNKVSLAFTEAEFPDVDDCKITTESDPENPLCARLVLLGSMANVTDPTELEFAKKAMFTRHLQMPYYPSSHDFRFMKLIFSDIQIIDYFGGSKRISVDDYFKAEP